MFNTEYFKRTSTWVTLAGVGVVILAALADEATGLGISEEMAAKLLSYSVILTLVVQAIKFKPEA